MAKPKPDQIIRHEYVLGKVERQQLEQASAAYSINRVLDPLVKLLNDVTGVSTVLALAAVFLGFKYDVYSQAGATTAELIADWREQALAAKVDLENIRSEYIQTGVNWWQNATDPGSYVDPLNSLLYSLTPMGIADNTLNVLGLPTIQGTVSSGISNLDLSPNFGDPWFGLDLNPFN